MGVAWLGLGLWPLGRADSDSAPPPGRAGWAAIDVPAALRRLAGEPPPVVTPLWQLPPRRLDYLSLAALLPVGPTWQNLEANSEQRQPLQLGASWREQVLLGQRAPRPRLPLPLKALAESQLPRLRQRLGNTPAEFEAWPTQNDVGRLTWVVSRWRPRGDAPWQWLAAPRPGGEPTDPNLVREPELVLPERLEPANPADLKRLVDDFLLAPNLYTKPRFSECVWTSGGGELALSAFAPSRDLRAQRELLRAASRPHKQALHCQAMPPPPRFGDHALTFVLRVTMGGALLWPDVIEWVAAPTLPAREPKLGAAVQLPRFPATFAADYRADVQALAGATPLTLSSPPRQIWLRRKNSADPQNQLGELLNFLEQRYQQLGLTVQRQRFTWRGVPQQNLIAVLPGKRGPGNRPVLLADHVDTALSEDVFAATGQRVSAPGADDNVTAVAALLRAAEALRPLPREHDIWLVHLTGEEYPADDLGARRLVSELLQRRVDIAALLLLDMIGHPSAPAPARQFQINPGGLFASGAASLRLAELTRLLTAPVAPTLQPVLVPVTDLRNYVYNTDGLIFAEAGFPVVFLNEGMNRYNLTRSGYHDQQDTVESVDFAYAADIAKVAITAAAVLSQQGPP